MTALLAGFAIGLLLAAVIGGYRYRRARALRDLEDQIPAWVNQGNQTVRDDFYEDFKTAVHLLLWEDEFERRQS